MNQMVMGCLQYKSLDQATSFSGLSGVRRLLTDNITLPKEGEQMNAYTVESSDNSLTYIEHTSHSLADEFS